MPLHGQSLIAGTLTKPAGKTFHAISPLDAHLLEPKFHEATFEDADRALHHANEAFALYRRTSAEVRAALLEKMIESARKKLPRRVFSKELIEQLFVRPYCKIRHLEDAGLAARVTASSYLQELQKAGFVRVQKAGTERLFINYRLVDLLAQTE